MLLCITVQCKYPTKCLPKLKWLGTCQILNEMFHVSLNHNLSYYMVTFKKIKAISLQALFLPEFVDNLHMKVLMLSALCTSCLNASQEIHLILIVVRACTDLSILSQCNIIT
jgi:uncharacterized protein with PhoU and TrkA domain